MVRKIHQTDPAVAQAIMRAAVECFERFGVRRATMDDIAATAKVARKTVYNYFQNKSELTVAVLEAEAQTVFAEAAQEVDFTLPPDEMIAMAQVRLLEHARKTPFAAIFLGPETLASLLDTASHQQRLIAVVQAYWTPVLDTLAGQGLLRADASREQIIQWINSIHLMCLSRPEILGGDLEHNREMLRLFLAPAILHDQPR
jgi:AcrR family transcriptional regulator